MSTEGIKLLVTGATGTAGAEALRQALIHPSVSAVTILTRRALPSHVLADQSNPKLNIILHQDFTSYPPSLISQLSGYSACIWDLGVSANGISEPDYEVITKEYPVAAAKAFSVLGTKENKFVFCYLSAVGVDQEERGWSMFGRVKGRAEVALACLRDGYPTLATYSFRPGGILPIHPTPNANLSQKIGNYLLPVLRPVCKSLVINADTLAQAMIHAALMGSQGWISGWVGKGLFGNDNVFDNEEMKALVVEK